MNDPTAIQTEAILLRFAAIGRKLAASAPTGLALTDHNTAARRHMTLGAARAAYQEIKGGHGNPLDWLYRVEEFAEFWMGGWPELADLIDFLTVTFDVVQ